MIKKIFFILLLCCYCSTVSALEKQTPQASAKLIASSDKENIVINLTLKPKNGWYIHSHHPGEFGMPAKVKWKEGNYSIVDESWSDGEDILYHGFGINAYKNYGEYHAIIKADSTVVPEFDLFFMSCKDECVPEKIHFAITSDAFIQDKLGFVPQNKETFWHAVLFAFIGGLILNLMPCVFPVLFIKIIGVIRIKNKKQSIIDSLNYMVGVVLSFLIIAFILRIFKQQGQILGWGFQLQSPYFVAIMAVVFFVLGLMFLDVIKVGVRMNAIPVNSFLTGLLSVLIASPCAAPFMGAAIGFVLTSNVPSSVFFSVFGALSLGYALPFTLAGFFPEFMQKILPRPGKWMLILKRFFALPMFVTCIWLLWVLWGNINVNDKIWQKYSPEKVETLITNGEKVFIDFSAKWCLTCLANEEIVLNSDDFTALAKERKIQLFKADWSSKDKEMVGNALSKYGRSSVPLYVYYSGNGEYIILPQLLNFEILSEKLQ